MWICKKCSERVEDNFDSCWNCGCDKTGVKLDVETSESSDTLLPNGRLLSQMVAAESGVKSKSEISKALIKRYLNGYQVARWLMGTGTIMKWISIFISMIIVFVGAWLSQYFGGTPVLVLSVVLALIYGTPSYFLGMLLVGQGALQLASLDTAVNTSRHLSKDEVAEIILG